MENGELNLESQFGSSAMGCQPNIVHLRLKAFEQ
jgi:hypothetical protein